MDRAAHSPQALGRCEPLHDLVDHGFDRARNVWLGRVNLNLNRKTKAVTHALKRAQGAMVSAPQQRRKLGAAHSCLDRER